MNFVWLTDIHLNFLSIDSRYDFYRSIIEKKCDGVFITGDISEAPSISEMLKEMADQIKKPIYFVLGNHDYYRGQVSEIKNEMKMLTKTNELLHWLPALSPQLLENDTILLGQDGWADGRYGDYTNSFVSLNDSRLIAELFQQRAIGKYPLLEKMQQLADADANQLHDDLINTIRQYHPKKIIVLTHVPPFREACLYEGKIASDDFLPFFSSKATGDVLLEMAKANSTIEFFVLCGHTHSQANYQPLANLNIKVGQAEYLQPEVQEVILI